MGKLKDKIKNRIKKGSPYKKCPRCGNKCLVQQTRCEDCGLVFSRLDNATNRAARKKLRHFDSDFVIYTNKYPKDRVWWKVLLMCFFTGLVGGQYYYTGKYLKGGLMSFGFLYLLFCTVFNTDLVSISGDMVSVFYAPIGVYAISWLVSIVYAASKKFKIPVAIEEDSDSVEVK